jgi:hypothetical protein
MTSEFPNLMIINGPNTVAPWASIIQGIEYQAAYAARLMKIIFKRGHPSYTGTYCMIPTPAAEFAWTKSLEAPLETLATSTKFGPGFYYLSREGFNTFFFPFRLSYYYWVTRKVREDLYKSWHSHQT